MDPTSASPLRQRLRRINAKVIQRRPRSIRRKFRALEPARWKFFSAIGQIFSTEHPQREHLFRRKIGREPGTKCASHWFCAEINVALLHFVVHLHPQQLHPDLLSLSFVSSGKRTSTSEDLDSSSRY